MIIVGKGGPTSHGFHQMQSILDCEKKYELAVKWGVRKPAEFTPNHFIIGEILHACKAVWFSRDFSTSPKTWRRIERAARRVVEEARIPATFKAEQLGLSYVRQYIDHWKVLPKPRPIAIEYLVGPVRLDEADPLTLVRTARLDAVCHYPDVGGLCIDETKSTSKSPSEVIRQYSMHGQTLLQYFLWKVAPQGEAKHGPILGTMLDIMQKGYGNRRSTFRRQFIAFEPHVLKWFKVSMRAYLRLGERIVNGDKTPLRNFGSCTGLGKYPCDYLDLCTYGRAASSKYIYGTEGRPLNEWTKTRKEQTPPWK